MEQAILSATIDYLKVPKLLENWPGYLEIRKYKEQNMVDQIQYFIDDFYENGKFNFIKTHLSISEEKIKDYFLIDS